MGCLRTAARLGVVITLALSTSFGVASAQQFLVANIDVPGGTVIPPGPGIVANGINDQGDVVGSYFDDNGTDHGFLLTRGVYTTIDEPDAAVGRAGYGTTLTGINAQGAIVGWFTGAVDGKDHSFASVGGSVRRDAQPLFVIIDAPGASETLTGGINDSGDIVGTYFDTIGGQHGFLLSNSVYTTLDAPGAARTSASGINDRGDIVGSYFDGSGVEHGFLLSDGVYTTIDMPGATSTIAAGINQQGDIVGNYNGYPGPIFLLSGGAYSAINIPGAYTPSTTATGVNSVGNIVGSYFDTNGFEHGFRLTLFHARPGS